MPGRRKRPSVTCFVTVSDLVFNDVSWFEGPSLRFYCNQGLFIEVSMADASKCNYPGACRIVDAYFRLNLSGWVLILLFRFRCLRHFSHLRTIICSFFWKFRILTFLWDFHCVSGHITTASECLISFAASGVISELWSRIFNLLFTLPGEMRWLRPFRTRCFTWILVIRSQFIQRIQLSRMRFVNSV